MYKKLINNIVDVIKESQIKLGFQSETIRLYYPLQTLNLFLGTELGVEEMHEVLEKFCDQMEEKFGRMEITSKKERFCFKFPPKTAEYIHEHTEKEGFMYDLIACVGKHGTTMEEVLDCFHRYSDRVHIQRMVNEDFDYLVYFEDGTPDEYRYCLTNEGHHVIYHRYTKEDYEALLAE